MATAIAQSAFGFSAAGTAHIGPPAQGHVWQIVISVPSAAPGQGFQILPGSSTMGNAVGTIQGQGSIGPLHLQGGSILTVQVTSGTVPTGPVIIQGWDFNLAQEPPGQIFVQNSGGTNSVQPVPAQNDVSGSGTIGPSMTEVITAPAGGQVLLRAVYVGALAPNFEGVILLYAGASTGLAQFSLLQMPFMLDFQRYPCGIGNNISLVAGSSSISATWTMTWDTY